MSVREFVRNAARFAATVRAPGNFRPAADAGISSQPVPIFVINLERSEHRRRFILKHLASVGLKAEIFPAVDGRTLDLAELERRGIYNDSVALEKFSRSLSLAEIGCALSHLGVCEKIIKDGIAAAIVLEDDAMFVEGIGARLPELLTNLPSDWDLVQLIFACKDYEPVNGQVVRFTMKPSMPVAATAYLVTRAGAIKIVENGYPIRYPADSLLGRGPRWGIAAYGAKPHLVEINNIFPSAIARDRDNKSKALTRIRELVVRLLD